jgi:ribosomal protein S27E
MPGDVIRIMCPRLTCRKVLAVPTTARGRTVRCRSCGATLRVPTKSTENVDPAAKPAEAPKPEQADAA